jgi:hypothetical protein
VSDGSDAKGRRRRAILTAWALAAMVVGLYLYTFYRFGRG